MADKINNEESIARVYKFLTDYNKSRGDWTVKADANNDGTIIKSEFFSFIKTNFNNWNGEEKSSDELKNDLINNFWASIDVNKVGKVDGSGIANVNALDKDEMKSIEKGMIVSQEVDSFVATLNPPQLLMSKKAQWKNSVRASLINKTLDFARGKSLDSEEAFKADVKGFLKDTYKATERMTNADYVATLALEKINVKGYAYGSDETLKSIISSYIQSIADKDVDFQDIYDTVTCLVNDYMATAGKGNGGSVGSSTAFDSYQTDEDGQIVTDENGEPDVASRGTNSNTTSTSRLEQYGYFDGGMLNDLQVAVLTDLMTSKIQAELSKSTYSQIYTAENKATIDAMIAKFIDSKLATATTDDFKALQNFNATEFVNSTEFATMKTEAEKTTKELKEAKTTLKNALVGKYTDKYKSVIQEVFGCSSRSEVEAAIDALKTVADVKAKSDAVLTKITDIDSQLPSTLLDAKIPSTISVLQSGRITIEDLPTSYGAYKTRDFKYEFEGDGVLSGSTYGETVTINGVKLVGDYHPVIKIVDAKTGKVLLTKEITVNVQKDITNNDDLTYGGKTLSYLASSNEIIELSNTGSTDDGGDSAKANAKTSISNICFAISNSLALHYPAEKVAKARDGVISYFSAIINAMYDAQWNDGDHGHTAISTSYQFNGKTYAINTDFYQKTRCHDSDARGDLINEMTNGGVANPDAHSGLGMWEGYNGYNSYGIYISTAAIIKKFQELLAQLS